MSRDLLAQQLPHTLGESHFEGLGERYVGKVRDVYRQGDTLTLVTSDRLSAFDRVLTTIPFKGEVLNRLAAFWFERTKHVVPNHVLDMPDPNVLVARACEPFRVEVVVRGYLTGSLWRDYEKGEVPYGLQLPPGLKRDVQFPAPILTPSTKAPKGEHDEPISEADVVRTGLTTAAEWGRIREYALALFKEGQTWAAQQGLLLVDTKYEFGKSNGTIVVIDEMHTPDSSRFWMADGYVARYRSGEPQRMLDKENIRQWLIQEKGFSGHGDAPAIPDAIRIDLAQKYLDAYAAITGAPLALTVGPVERRIRGALGNH